MTNVISNPLAGALARVDQARPDGFTADGEARPHLTRALWDLQEAVRQHLAQLPELQCSGVETARGYTQVVSAAEDYARYAAAAMNAAGADDTEFIADGATVTAYVHCLAHVSATFARDEGRPYPGDAEGDYFEVTPADWTAGGES